jgi:predicted RNA binding protein YcfA (HicA-like mRNA interferase family)
MSGLHQIHWKEFEKFLVIVGCVFVREKGDHRIWKRAGLKRPIVLPRDSSLPIFVIRNNLRLLNISPDEYLKIMRED